MVNMPGNEEKFTSSEEAKKETKDVHVNIEQFQTVAGDIYELKKDVAQTQTQINQINIFIFGAFLAMLIAFLLFLADYCQFATKAYIDFNETLKQFKSDSSDIKSLKSDLEILKHKKK